SGVAAGLMAVALQMHVAGTPLQERLGVGIYWGLVLGMFGAALLTALSRLGAGSRVVLTHDVAQRDNLRVGRHDGIASVIDALRGHPIFAHVTLNRSERSAIAALVTSILDTY
ncbi:MAG: PhoH family protein, partial [Actinobacteria bacterium]|nr:PhoH family protein [Actinomycetota bacterium]